LAEQRLAFKIDPSCDDKEIHLTQELLRVCKISDLQPGRPGCYRVHGIDVFVVQYRGEIYALQNRCGHMAAALHHGDFTDGLIVCPLHGAAFRVESGAVEWNAILPPPMSEWVTSDNPRLHRFGELIDAIETLPIKTYTVVIDGDDVLINLQVRSPEDSLQPGAI